MLMTTLLKSCWIALGLALLLIPVLFVACQKTHDDYYTQAHIRLLLPENMTIEKMQGNVRLTNLNNRQTFTSSTFDGNQVQTDVFRGVYAVDVEGSVRYRDAEGQMKTANFRANTPYVQVLDHPAMIELNVTLM